jgi:hypothetical protein
VPTYVSSYLVCIGYILLVMSPLFVPVGVTIAGTISDRRAARREKNGAKSSTATQLNDQSHRTKKRFAAALWHAQACDESIPNDRSTTMQIPESRPSGVAQTRA